jgi:hypothetical protein
LILVYFLVGLEFELRTLPAVYNLSHTSSPFFALGILEVGVARTNLSHCPGVSLQDS